MSILGLEIESVWGSHIRPPWGWVDTSSSGLCLGARGSTEFSSTSPTEGTASPAPPLELRSHREPPHTELPPATAAIPPAASSGPGHRQSPERHRRDASPGRPHSPAHRGAGSQWEARMAALAPGARPCRWAWRRPCWVPEAACNSNPS